MSWLRAPYASRSRALLLVVISALAALACGGDQDPLAQWSPGAARNANLLLITLDTTRADRLGSYGYAGARTPALDALASAGLRFEHAVSVAPLTLPSHTTMMTGLLPYNHRVRLNGEHRLDTGARTLAELFSATGYETAAFVSAFVLDARYGLDQGFDLYDDRVTLATGSTFPSGTLERPAAATADAFLGWLEQRDAERPFFAWVHFFDPHAPYAPPLSSSADFALHPYDGEIAAVDSQVGRLVAALAQRPGRTVIVAVADHGESLGEHEEQTHSIFLYEPVMRVPLIVACPPLLSPGVVDRVVSTADLLPSVASFFGLEDDTPRDGRAWGVGVEDPHRAVYMESVSPELDYGWAPLYGLRTRAAKLIFAPRSEYYDLRHDPGETENLYNVAVGAAAAERDRLRGELTALVAVPPTAASPLGVEPSRPSPPAEATRDDLAALGYLIGAGPGAARADPKDMIGVANALIAANGRLTAGRPDAALEIAREAVAASPNDRSALQLLGKVLLRLDRPAEAEVAFRRFRAIQPKADVSLLLAQIVLLDGRFAEAAELLAEAERLDPDHGGIAIARGDLLLRQGNVGAARLEYERAMLIDPYRSVGTARARLGSLPPSEAPRETPGEPPG